VSFRTVLFREKLNYLLRRLEGLNIMQIDGTAPKTLGLFKLVPIENFDRKICRLSGWLMYRSEEDTSR
jgi:hypothetical protein